MSGLRSRAGWCQGFGGQMCCERAGGRARPCVRTFATIPGRRRGTPRPPRHGEPLRNCHLVATRAKVATRILGIGTLAIWALGSRLVQVVRSLSGADSVPADHGDGCASRPHSYGVRSALRASAQHAQGSEDRQKRARLVRVSQTGHPSVAQRCGAQRYRRSAAASAHILARVALPDRPRGPSCRTRPRTVDRQPARWPPAGGCRRRAGV